MLRRQLRYSNTGRDSVGTGFGEVYFPPPNGAPAPEAQGLETGGGFQMDGDSFRPRSSTGWGRPTFLTTQRLIWFEWLRIRAVMDKTQLQLERIGIWTRQFEDQPAGKAQEAAAELETLGYGAIWFGEAVGREALTHAGLLLSATRRITIATG